jgi:predicted membrane channel-forming protein YqfA (hemolysin III family)
LSQLSLITGFEHGATISQFRGANAMSADDGKREARFHLWGWLLFVVCAGFFIASSVESSDILGLIGSIIFLIACVVFIVPFAMKKG